MWNNMVSATSVSIFLALRSKLFIWCGENALCVEVSVWMLTRAVQVIAAAHRDLSSRMRRPTNEPWLHAKTWWIWLTLQVKIGHRKSGREQQFSSQLSLTAHGMLVLWYLVVCKNTGRHFFRRRHINIKCQLTNSRNRAVHIMTWTKTHTRKPVRNTSYSYKVCRN